MEKKLSNIDKKVLQKKACSLKPVVMIGQHGLTNAVLAEVDVALNAHELIKLRIRGADKNIRPEQFAQIECQLKAEWVHKIGGITVLYQPATVSL